MSDHEQVNQIISRLPEYKMAGLLAFLQGMAFDDDLEDTMYCEKLVDDYLNDPDPEKHHTISIEELAKREGVKL